MFNFISKLSTSQKLALVAFLLGFAALFAGDPYKSAKTTISQNELALLVQNKTDHITVDDLADWIIKGKADYKLVDLNEEKDFKEYHIPGAINITLPMLLKGELQRNDRIILYSNGGIHAAQAWMLLRSNEFKNSYTLLGGLEEWKDRVLFPQIPDTVPAGKSEFYTMLKERSRYFGGMPQSSSPDVVKSTAPALPKLQMGGSASAPAAGGKKKKEGC